VKPHSSRLQLGNYAHRVDIPSRFADVDPLWHLNNVRIVELYQEGRVAFNQTLGREYNLLRDSDHRLVVARQSVDYLGEVKWPGSVLIGIAASRVGSSSFTLALAMFQHDNCVGVSDTVMVYASARGPQPLPDRMRELLQKNLFRDPAGLA
jgi:acyl-CoA thioester hydrolase